jgi:hypothetical protein
MWVNKGYARSGFLYKWVSAGLPALSAPPEITDFRLAGLWEVIPVEPRQSGTKTASSISSLDIIR